MSEFVFIYCTNLYLTVQRSFVMNIINVCNAIIILQMVIKHLQLFRNANIINLITYYEISFFREKYFNVISLVNEAYRPQ